MKHSVLIASALLIGALCFGLEDAETRNLSNNVTRNYTDAETKQLNLFQQECANQTNTNNNELKVLSIRNFANKPSLNVKNYYVCFWRKLGFLNEENIIQVEALKGDIHLAKEETLRLITKCIVDKDSVQDTVYDAVVCLEQNHPDATLDRPISASDKRLIAEECLRKTNLNYGKLLESLYAILLTADPKLKKFLLCLFDDLGLFDANEDINKTKLKEILPLEEAHKWIEKCAFKRNTAEETAFETIKCIEHSRRPGN